MDEDDVDGDDEEEEEQKTTDVKDNYSESWFLMHTFCYLLITCLGIDAN